MELLRNWLPIRVWQQAGEWRVDWCWFGERKLVQPFFRDAVDEALRLPFNQAFRRETPLAVLSEWRAPAVAPTAFIYHASRCGSTLLSQMLAQLDDHIVISEPPALDSLLRSELESEERRAALRGLLAAYGQRRHGDERALVIKLDAWNIGELALLRECFPETPWLFVYRDPLEIAVSHWRRAGMHMVPGMIGETCLDTPGQEDSREDYIAARLGRLFELAAQHCQALGGLPVNYRELPLALGGHLGEFFGLDAQERQQTFAATGQHAKQPDQAFVPDSQDKHRDAPERLKERVSFWAEAPYQALEHLRLA
ncbi:sulfotransferase family protein [Pseudomonas fuscovaginae UPB0736]|uniref:sulfotransferase family protein n=1 Tax=Pseudomonas asplenii TaxID=53407 RepID=UPI0002880592|nr:sulfotransferase family protein [Pseudomonas fuscovaginae]UUQ67420.1 sulfotransferase family protein [Pseudomonas fuscovaginae UPB0736]